MEKCSKTLHQSRNRVDKESEMHPYTELERRIAMPSLYMHYDH